MGAYFFIFQIEKFKNDLDPQSQASVRIWVYYYYFSSVCVGQTLRKASWNMTVSVRFEFGNEVEISFVIYARRSIREFYLIYSF